MQENNTGKEAVLRVAGSRSLKNVELRLKLLLTQAWERRQRNCRY